MVMMYVGHIAAYTGGLAAQVGWPGPSEGRRPPRTGAGLHSSDEPGELSQ